MNERYCRFDSSDFAHGAHHEEQHHADDGVTNTMDGPAKLMVLPEPMNRPVPIAPPMAMSWMWRLVRLRCRSSWPCVRLASEGTLWVMAKALVDGGIDRRPFLAPFVSTRPKEQGPRSGAAANTDENGQEGEHKPKGKP